jgi:hypothetical protein
MVKQGYIFAHHPFAVKTDHHSVTDRDLLHLDQARVDVAFDVPVDGATLNQRAEVLRQRLVQTFQIFPSDRIAQSEARALNEFSDYYDRTQFAIFYDLIQYRCDSVHLKLIFLIRS